MSEKRLCRTYEGQITAKGYSFAIVLSRFNDFITSKLLDGALDAIKRHEGDLEKVEIFRVPGAFEIPSVARKLANKGKYDAIICLGAVIRGDTPHFEYVAAESAKGVAQVAMEANIPVIYGILTTDNIEQAIERAGTKAGNKGYEAAISAMEMVDLLKKI